jgi:hypothetical protein
MKSQPPPAVQPGYQVRCDYHFVVIMIILALPEDLSVFEWEICYQKGCPFDGLWYWSHAQRRKRPKKIRHHVVVYCVGSLLHVHAQLKVQMFLKILIYLCSNLCGYLSDVITIPLKFQKLHAMTIRCFSTCQISKWLRSLIVQMFASFTAYYSK